MPSSFRPSELFLGKGDHALEVALASADQRPRAEDVRKLWSARQGRRPSPLLLIVGYPGAGGEARVTVCGPVGDQPPVVGDLEVSQVERLAGAALGEPNRHSAVRFLVAMLPEVGADLAGLRNAGLLATQELRRGVPERSDWDEACRRSRSLLPLRGRGLVEELGFDVEQLSVSSSVLTISAGGRRAVAVFLDEGETFEDPAARFGTSPVSHALALADREGLPWVVLTRGRQIRLYAARSDTGVGRKGRSETFAEVNLALLPGDSAGYLSLLFSAEALKEGGRLDEVLERSADFAADLAVRLRERVYFEAVPELASAVAARLDDSTDLAEADLAAAYERTLTILFRLLFLAYAEDKDLLPYRTNGRYADHSLKRIARRLADDRQADREQFDPEAIDHWEDVAQLWRAVDKGNTAWGVPGYNGGLFSVDPAVNEAGAALAKIELTDAEFGPALSALLVDEGPDGLIGPVDFRSLSVREFGTIYEGLLESQLSVAPTTLTVDARGNFVPAQHNDDVVVHAGGVYFHNRSGARKASGSYFTKPFAVEHLLNHALEPALAHHLARISALLEHGDEAAATEAFFDFRCVDLAMGSGHFLVAAVDRIEARLSGFLALHPIGPVNAELEALRRAALDALGELSDGVEIETTSLLRRQVARRCVYGVDANHVSVELARLAIWIHTFVPGLPLSFLDHSLRWGNSLTGIGTLNEAIDLLDPKAAETGAASLFRGEIEAFLDRAGHALRRLARTTEATVADVEIAREANREAEAAVQPARDLFDLLVAGRLGEIPMPITADEDAIADDPGLVVARELGDDLDALHFPVAFPEVFVRDRPGFDCILGNPPWDKVLFEPQQFWVTRSPGLNTLSEARRSEKINELRGARPEDAAAEAELKASRELLQDLIEQAYPNRGRGHYDFAKLFAERAVNLVRETGTVGYVLPASSLLLGGWGKLRELWFAGSHLLAAQARNTRGWLFEDVHQSYSVALLSRTPVLESARSSATLIPGVTSLEALKGADLDITLTIDVLRSLSDSVVVPWINHPRDASLFESMRSEPSLGGREGWITGHHDARWDFRSSGPNRRSASTTPSRDSWRVLMTRHVVPFGISEAAAFQQYLPSPSALRGATATDAGGEPELVEEHPLIVMRHPSRNDDSRTLIATALPSSGFLHNKGYVHAIRQAPGAPTDTLLALLAYLNSFTCDWWVRRFVDRHITAPVVNNIRLPAWDDSTITRAADLAAGRLIVNGTATLAGGRPLHSFTAELADYDSRAEIEGLSARGFGFARADMEMLLEDFSRRDAACPPALRTLILERLG